MVGGNEYDLKHYRALAKDLDMSADHILFVGRRPSTEIPIYLKACDVLVMPFPWNDHFAYFMSPLKLFEYMASRRAIIATDLPSVREVVGNNEVFFSPPNEPHTFAQSIRYALAHPEEAAQKAEAAFIAVQQYDWRERGRHIINIL